MTSITSSLEQQDRHKFTALEIEEKCPSALENLRAHIAIHLEKVRICANEAEQHTTTAAKYLELAKRACDDGGFTAFREKFFPDLGRTRVYELLAIAEGKKTLEATKTCTRERVAKHRAKRAMASVTVTDTPSLEGAAQTAPTPGGVAKPRNAVHSKDEALFNFTALVLELHRRINGQKVERFANTAVSAEVLAKLAEYFKSLENLKRLTAFNANVQVAAGDFEVADKLAA